MRLLPALWVVFVLLFAFTNDCRAQPREMQDTLSFVKTAHRASREQIRTSYCRVKFEITTGKISQTCVSEYWHTGDANRLKAIENGQTIDYVIKDSVRQSIVQRENNKTNLVAGNRDSLPGRYVHRGDAWVRGLLVLNLPESGRSVPFETFVDLASKVEGVTKRTEQGREVLEVSLRFDPSNNRQRTWRVEIQFDPSLNYLVRKISHSIIGGPQFTRTEEVVQFKDCGQGIFFPEHIVGTSQTGEDNNGKSDSVLSDIRVNLPIGDEAFKLQFPKGTILTDSIRGTYYRVDADGTPLTKERELKARPSPSNSSDDSSQPVYVAETKEEPKPWFSSWLPWVSGALIVIGLALAVHRRRKCETP